MAGITVTADELAQLLGQPIPAERWEVVETLVLRVIRTGTYLDPATVEGRAQAVMDSVFTSVATRLLLNPGGVSLVGMGSAQVSFGGASEALALTDEEKRQLASLRKKGKPSFIVHSSPYEARLMPRIPRGEW